MTTTRRDFIASALSGGAVAAAFPCAAGAQFLSAPRHGLPGTLQERYAKLDAILKEPVFKRDLFPDPVIIEWVELLRTRRNICVGSGRRMGMKGSRSRMRADAGAVSDVRQTHRSVLYGEGCARPRGVIPELTVYENNYKAQGLAIWVPIATIEFAILDMFGKMANLPMGLLIGDKIHNKKIRCTRRTGNATFQPKRRLNI